MENPQIRIESDGKITKLWVNGEQQHNLTSLTFEASVGEAYCEVKEHVIDDNGNFVLNDDKTEILQKERVLLNVVC